jgi:hypothetical protein
MFRTAVGASLLQPLDEHVAISCLARCSVNPLKLLGYTSGAPAGQKIFIQAQRRSRAPRPYTELMDSLDIILGPGYLRKVMNDCGEAILQSVNCDVNG